MAEKLKKARSFFKNPFKATAKKKLGDAPVKPKRKPAGNTDVTGKSTRISKNTKTAPKPTRKPKAPAKKGISSTRKRFNAAFAAARRAGKKEFTFEGKRFNTKLKGE